MRRIAGHDVDDVDTHVLGVAEKPGNEEVGSGGDPLQTLQVERAMRRCNAGAGLDLDKGEQLAAAGDQIDLADRRSHPFGENLPALPAEVGSGLGLGAPAPAFGFDAGFAQRLSSSARS